MLPRLPADEEAVDALDEEPVPPSEVEAVAPALLLPELPERVEPMAATLDDAEEDNPAPLDVPLVVAVATLVTLVEPAGPEWHAVARARAPKIRMPWAGRDDEPMTGRYRILAWFTPFADDLTLLAPLPPETVSSPLLADGLGVWSRRMRRGPP